MKPQSSFNKLMFIPLVLFLLLVVAFLIQLTRNANGEDPTMLESALIGKPVPAFKLESLEQPGKTFDQAVLRDGKPILLNVWATWCPTCRAEHEYLNKLAAQGIRVVGLNYKDDRSKAVQWLNSLGNPYFLSLYDGDGMLGLDLGYTAHQKRSLSMVKGLSVTAMPVILMIGSGSRKSYRCIKSIRGRMRLLSLLLGLILSWGVLATIDTYRFSSVEQEQQYRALTEQLRCPKCQNNSIADSNATIAADMRAKVYELMQQGYSKQQIVDYMVARYGNFVTYEPPVTAATIILWAGPLLFVLIGAAIVVLRARRRVEKEPPLSQQEQQRLQSLLAENSVLQNNALQNNKLQEESDRKKP